MEGVCRSLYDNNCQGVERLRLMVDVLMMNYQWKKLGKHVLRDSAER